MTDVKDVRVEVSRLQKEIEDHIALNTTNIMFEFDDMDGKTKLNVITVNPQHRQSFLFHSVYGFDKRDALDEMLNYVKTYKDKDSSYTLQWSLKGESELNTSYFRASNIHAALEKLYFGRDASSIVVFSVVLNPIT